MVGVSRKRCDMSMLRLRNGVAAGLLALACSSLTGCQSVVGNRQFGASLNDAGLPRNLTSDGAAPNEFLVVGAPTDGATPASNAIMPIAAIGGVQPANDAAVIEAAPTGRASCCSGCDRHCQSEPVVTAPTLGPLGDSAPDRASLAAHKVAPPDILRIEVVRLTPRPSYRLQPLESLVVTVSETLPGEPINGPFVIS